MVGKYKQLKAYYRYFPILLVVLGEAAYKISDLNDNSSSFISYYLSGCVVGGGFSVYLTHQLILNWNDLD